METETNNQLPFLDVLIYKKPNGSLGHTIYRKKTHTNRYLNAQSHHHPAQINSVAKTLISRTKCLADKDHLKTELHTLTNVLISNGFQRNTITNLILKETSPQNQDTEQDNGIALLPYIKGTTDKISKILHKHNIRTAFGTDQKIANILRNPKDKIQLENQGVYEIPCNNCPATYIGQTNRRINARIAEHKNAVRKGENTSSLFQHLKATGHEINFEGTKLISNTEHFNKRIIREAIEIEKHPHNMNKRDDTSRLPDIWKLALINKRVPAMKINTGPITTHDATTSLPHQTQTQTHPIDKRQPSPRNQTTATSPAPAPPKPQTKKTDKCHENIARPQTRSQTKAQNVTSQPPAQDATSQHSEGYTTEHQDVATQLTTQQTSTKDPLCENNKSQKVITQPINQIVTTQEAEGHTASTSATKNFKKKPTNQQTSTPSTNQEGAIQPTNPLAAEPTDHTPPPVYIERQQLRSHFARRGTKQKAPA